MSSTDIAGASAAFEAAKVEDAFWQAHHAEFLEKYPDQFVAARIADGEVVATSQDLREIEVVLERRGLDMTDVWLEFMDSDPGRLIL